MFPDTESATPTKYDVTTPQQRSTRNPGAVAGVIVLGVGVLLALAWLLTGGLG